MYEWRKMTTEEREIVLAKRVANHRPWHSPPRQFRTCETDYMFTASCFNHLSVIGTSLARMIEFEEALLQVADESCSKLHAWVLLPNHYHFLAKTDDCQKVIRALGRLHGSTSFRWNGADGKRGRQVWFSAVETLMKSDRHFWATINYIHHNPVKHGHVKQWQQWPFGSAGTYLKTVGREEAERTWKEYPVEDYGNGWDL